MANRGTTNLDDQCSTSCHVRRNINSSTLLPYGEAREMGSTLVTAVAADGGMFAKGAVKLCHHHCAKFCVLGGGSCS